MSDSNAELDYEIVSSEFIRELRGSQSQRTLSRRLGFKSNVVYHWEAGRRSPSTLQVIELLTLVKPARIARSSISTIRSVEDLGAYLNDMMPVKWHGEVSDMLERSTQTIRRWVSGESQPRFPEFLAFLDVNRRFALDWLADYVDPAKLDQTRAAWLQTQKIRTIGSTMPMSMAVINAVELAEYKALPKHVPGWIARRLGISEGEESYIVEALDEIGLLIKEDGRWAVNVDFISLVRGSISHWVQACQDDPFERRFFVSAVSEDTYNRVRDATRRYWSELGEILAADEEPDRIVAMTLLAARVDD